jgi:hypothetical protein
MRATESSWAIASSWSLRNHYTNPEIRHGKPGYAVCSDSTQVYDDSELARYGFTTDALAKPRPMCKRCERLRVKTP